MSEEKKEYHHAAGGAFTVYHGIDNETGKPVVLLIERGERFRGTDKEGHGMPGGHIDLITRSEQPREAASREFAEEVLCADGESVLKTITPDRLELVDTGVDYSAGREGTLHTGVIWNAFQCSLAEGEVTALKQHAQKMKNDSDYAAAVRDASEGEIETVYLMDADELVRKIENNDIKFAYAHEKQIALQVAREISPADSRPTAQFKTKR